MIPGDAPVLAFARFSVKPRPDDGVDFIRLGEEMFASARLDVPLALAREPRLDRADDWDCFGAVLIADYAYDWIDRAYEAVERASRSHPVVLWPSADPLFPRLAALAGVRVVDPPPPPAVDTPAARRAFGREACRRILDALDAVPGPTPRRAQGGVGAPRRRHGHD